MKNIINNMKRLLSNTFVRLMLELSLLVLTFNINTFIGIGLLLILLVEIVFFSDIKYLLYIVLFLSFNDDILIFDFLHGSISKVVIILVILKTCIYIFKNKVKPNMFHIGTCLFFFASCLISLTNIAESVIIVLNVLTIILLSISIKITKQNELNVFIEQLFIVVVISVLCGILYGLGSFNFLVYNQDGNYMFRFNGTYEPNFMAMYINIAILSLLAIKQKINAKLYYLLFAILINACLLTVSMTGIIMLFFSLVIYFTFNVKNWRKILKNSLIIFIISIVMFFGIKNIYFKNVNIESNVNKNIIEILEDDYNIDQTQKIIKDFENNKKYGDDGYKSRAHRIINQLKQGKIDDITSGRTALIRDFFKKAFKRPVVNILFGNNPTNKKVYSSFFGKKCFSHNSYVDILYNFGVIGFLIAMILVFKRVIKNLFINQSISNNKYSKNIKIIRIVLLLYALTLTLYTKRMILIFFLL